MLLNQYIKTKQIELQRSGIKSARLDVLILLEDTLNKDRAWLLANQDLNLTSQNIEILNKLFKLRSTHIPLAYIRGHVEFYGRTFVINASTLVPRPESEDMVSELINLAAQLDLASKNHKNKRWLRVADVGTGSGALGITAYLETSNTLVDLIDIDKDALKVAKINVDIFTLNLSIIKNDLLANLTNEYDVLLCNLPYVPNDFEVNEAAKKEPRIALYGGHDGLDLYRRLYKQLEERAIKPLYILSESLPMQHETLVRISESHGYKLRNTNNYIQVFKLT